MHLLEIMNHYNAFMKALWQAVDKSALLYVSEFLWKE